jgi:hypothetical protein
MALGEGHRHEAVARAGGKRYRSASEIKHDVDSRMQELVAALQRQREQQPHSRKIDTLARRTLTPISFRKTGRFREPRPICNVFRLSPTAGGPAGDRPLAMRVAEDWDMPQTEPIAPPDEPQQEPAPAPLAPPRPGRELDPFNPDWPATRPTPEPKARILP